jgi:hypothetical protein
VIPTLSYAPSLGNSTAELAGVQPF